MGRGPVRATAVGAALLLLLVPACSSTATRPDAARRAADGARAGSDAPAAAIGEEGDEGAARPGAAAPARRGGAADAGRAPGTGGPSGSQPASGRRPVTDTEIRIGLRYQSEASTTAFAAGFGIQQDDQPSDVRGLYDTLVRHVNESGGVAGRKLVAIHHEEDIAVHDPAATSQKTCEYFTQDEPVFAILTIYPSHPVINQCLARYNVPFIQSTLAVSDRKMFDDWPGLLHWPNAPSTTRGTRVMVDGLLPLGYYEPGAKLGLVWTDDADGIGRRVRDEGYLPALRAHGLALADEAILTSYTNQAQYQSAVLRFKSAGITHVQFLGYAYPLMVVFFLTNAENQLFRPRYGFNSQAGLTFQMLAAPREQLRRSVATGWMPTRDVEASQDPGRTAGGKRCLDVFTKAGHRLANRADEGTAVWICDSVFFFKRALEAGGGDVTVAALRMGAEGLGESFEPASTFGSRFGPRRYDGGSLARNLVYEDGCSCYRYVGSTYPIT